MASRGKNMPFSGNRRERVLNAESGDFLSRVQVFRKNPCCAALGGSSDDECIPETDTRFVFNAECHGKLNWSRFHAPDRVATNYKASRIVWQGRANLAGYVHVEFLQNLQAQNTSAFAPKLTQNVFGDCMFGFESTS